MIHRPNWVAAAVLTLIAQAGAQAQTTPAAPAADTKLERVEVTGSMIKRIDKETASPVQVITKEEIRASGYSSTEELLRATSAVDTGSIGDAAASGFVGGVSTISLRGFGSQGTLILINGRRIAPVAAVDINFGRGSLLNVNTIPKGALERIEILKDGASAIYGSDAMAGVINYILRKDYEGIEGNVSYSANDQGVGVIKNGGVSFGFGSLDKDRFNVFGGIELQKRDSVMNSELKDRGNFDLYNQYLNTNGALSRFTPDSSASFHGNYYRVPTSLAGSTVIDGRTVANNNLSGANYLGTLPGCPDANTVGKGVPLRPDGFAATTASLRNGYCRFNFDNSDEAIAAQDKASGMLRGTFAINNDLTAYVDLMFSRTKTVETRTPYAMTTTLVTAGNRTAVTWPKLDGSFLQQPSIILPVNHPDNPTRGTATPQEVQLIYRFEDLDLGDINTMKSTRLLAGIEGNMWGWDLNGAAMMSMSDNERVQQDRVRSSLLNASIAAGTYRFGGTNSEAAKASVASDAYNSGKSKLYSLDLSGSRELFELPGGKAAIAVGGEVRKESLQADTDDTYKTGDYTGLVANSASGSRKSFAAFTELSLPLVKSLETQVAVRYENYDDFGTSTTGKLGAKWAAVPNVLAFRGTAATGFRAPSISQIGQAVSLSFHSFQERRIIDPLRCNGATFTSLANPGVNRDCNVLGYTAVPSGTVNPGSIASLVSANPNLKPETSKSFTMGMLLQPSKDVDLAIDGWYFHRDNEIRAGRGVDIMDDFVASGNGQFIVRDPNPQTWLPGVPNSGPIIMLVRQYTNAKWTKTSGIDYDLNVRLPASQYGKFSLNLRGTYTGRYDQQILEGGPIARYVGTSSIDIAKSKAILTLRWKTDKFSSFLRWNHTDPIDSSLASCQVSTTAAGQMLRAYDRCMVGKEKTVDLGVSYSGIKNLTLNADLLNVANDYNRSSGIPAVFTYWDPGPPGQLGRRFALSASYQFK